MAETISNLKGSANAICQYLTEAKHLKMVLWAFVLVANVVLPFNAGTFFIPSFIFYGLALVSLLAMAYLYYHQYALKRLISLPDRAAVAFLCYHRFLPQCHTLAWLDIRPDALQLQGPDGIIWESYQTNQYRRKLILKSKALHTHGGTVYQRIWFGGYLAWIPEDQWISLEEAISLHFSFELHSPSWAMEKLLERPLLFMVHANLTALLPALTHLVVVGWSNFWLNFDWLVGLGLPLLIANLSGYVILKSYPDAK